MNHLGQPIQCGIWVSSAHGLDECRDGVVVSIPIPIIDHRFFLNACLHDFQTDVDVPILMRIRGRGSDLQGIESFSGIPIGNVGQMI